MTTPIPESAVEAAARAAFAVFYEQEVAEGRLPSSWEGGPESMHIHWHAEARAALTAARPLMEAEAKAEAWDEGADWHHRANPVERIRRLTVGQGNPYRAATIAERTNDEPA